MLLKDKIRNLSIMVGILLAIVTSCNRSSKTKLERDATYIENGDTIDPTEGVGEGSSGHKYMEPDGSEDN